MSSAISRAFPTDAGRAAIITTRRLAARAALLLATLALAGCGALRIGYSAAPDAVYWQLDRYVDFDGDQTPVVREAIARWFEWHRRSQLPEYADRLRQLRTEALADTTPERACAWQREATSRARLAFDRFAPSIAAFLPTMDARQVEVLERRYAKLDDTFRDDYLQPDPRRRAERARERVIDRAESLYGRLDAAQRERIAATLARSPFDPVLWLAERQWRQRETLRIVREAIQAGRGAPSWLDVVTTHADRIERSPNPEYRRYVARLTEFNCAFAAEIHNATTPAQRRTAAERIEGWEGDFRALSTAKAAERRVDP